MRPRRSTRIDGDRTHGTTAHNSRNQRCAPGAESPDLWDLRNLAAAKRLCDFQFEQVPRGFGARVVELGAGIGTFSERLLAAGARELLLIEPETACVAELEARFASDAR